MNATNTNTSNVPLVLKNASADAPTIEALASQDGIGIDYGTIRDEDDVDTSNVQTFLKPTDVIVSRWYPGYRMTSLRGPDAEESIAVLLAEALAGEGKLERFKRMLSSPLIPVSVVTKLFPRAGAIIKKREYHVSEAFVRKTVADVLLSVDSEVEPAMIDAYSNVFVRVLSSPALDMVQLGEEQRIVGTAKSYALDIDDLRRVLLIDSMRGVFSDARISEATRALDNNSTPQVLADTLARLFRRISHVIPEIELRLEQLDDAVQTLRSYLLKPDTLPKALRAFPALQTLGTMANFVRMAVRSSHSFANAEKSVQERKDACTALLNTIQAAPSIELVTLPSFYEHLGVVPIATPDGFRRGAVFYMQMAQTSRMEVVDVISPGGMRYEMAQLATDYVRATSVAAPLSTIFGAPSAITGLANIIADEVSRGDWASGAVMKLPSYATIGVTEEDLDYFAMAKADVLAVTGGEVTGLLYGCSPAPEWRTRVLAATPDVAYFANPLAVLVYTSPTEQVEARPLPNRSQSLGTIPGRDIVYVGDIMQYLDKDVQRPFRFPISVVRGAADPITLNLNVGVISHLLGFDPANGVPARDDAFYASVAEPGVDAEYKRLFAIVLAYAKSNDSLLADRARSWLVEHLAPLVTHPSVMRVAEKALNTAVLEAKVDLRAYAASYKETVVRALFGTLLGVLARFNKVNATQVVDLTAAVPISGITIKAQLAMAGLPAVTHVPTPTSQDFETK